jgi:hypothetical protein
MAYDTADQIIDELQGIVEGADPNLATIWVRDAARRTFEARHWSFLLRRNQFVLPAPTTNVSSGATCAVTQNSSTVTFSAGIVTQDMVGQQFRTSTSDPVYDIVGYNSDSSFEIFPYWGGATAGTSSFSVFTAYLQMPQDFLRLLSVVDLSHRYRLNLNISQNDLDQFDPSRASQFSSPVLLSPRDYTQTYIGKVYGVIQVLGAGSKPFANGTYTGQSDSLYTIQMTSSAVGGVATFQWKKGEGSFTPATTDAVNGNTLPEGVTLVWSSSAIYTSGDVFVVRVTSTTSPGVPRMEIYPYPNVRTILPYHYISRYPDVTQPGVALPGLFAGRGDVLREKAQEFAAAYPGPKDQKNSYDQINRRDYHANNWRDLVEELSRQDNEIFQRNVSSNAWNRFPFAPMPWYGGDYLQTHDAPDLYNVFS